MQMDFASFLVAIAMETLISFYTLDSRIFGADTYHNNLQTVTSLIRKDQQLRHIRQNQTVKLFINFVISHVYLIIKINIG